MVVRTVPPSNSPNGVIVPPHESLPLIPPKEARLVHRRIREAPQRVISVGNKMRRDNQEVAFIQDNSANRTLCFAGKD